MQKPIGIYRGIWGGGAGRGAAQILKGEMLLVSTSYEDQVQVKIRLLP